MVMGARSLLFVWMRDSTLFWGFEKSVDPPQVRVQGVFSWDDIHHMAPIHSIFDFANIWDTYPWNVQTSPAWKVVLGSL